MLENKYVKYGIGIILLIITILGLLNYELMALAIFAFLTIICMKEFRETLNKKGIYPHKFLPEIFGLIIALIYTGSPLGSKALLIISPIIILFIILSFLITILMNKKPYMTNTFATIGEFALMLCALFPLRMIHFPDIVSNYLIITFFASILFGSLAEILIEKYAKNKTILCPDICPNKTIAGIVVNLIVSVIVSFVLTLGTGLPIWFGLILGSVTSATSQLGDFAINLIKREMEIDNFGEYFLERGGFLDSIGVILFSAPIVYILFLIKL